MATCDFCGASSAALLACARCNLVSYCGKGCQAKHWKEGGHKKRCKNKDVILETVFQAANKGDSVEMKRLLTGYSTILTVKVKNIERNSFMVLFIPRIFEHACNYR